MAKAEYDMTPLEVQKVATKRNQEEVPWALAVASTGIQLCLGDNFKKNKPVEYEKLCNWFAQQLVVAKETGSKHLTNPCAELPKHKYLGSNVNPITGKVIAVQQFG